MSVPTNHSIRVFIADDHALFREDLKGLVSHHKGLHVVGEAGDGDAALRQIQNLKPELVLLDISMPKMNGLEVAACIRKSTFKTSIILVTTYKTESFFNEAMDLDIEGYVLKDDMVMDLPEALSRVTQGHSYISGSLTSIAQQWSEQKTQAPTRKLDGLTPQELRVLRLMAEPMGNEAISRQLSLPPKAIDVFQSSINLKFEFSTDQELQDFAIQRRAELQSFKLVPQDHS